MNDFKNIVLSSRVRLARNIKGIKFPLKLSDYDEALSITKGVYEVLSNYGDFEFYKVKNLPDIQSLMLLEQNLISKELLDNKDISAVGINLKDNLSIMINEEDHIRQQCVLEGFQLEKAYEIVNQLDEILLEHFAFAFDEKLGFLTASPTNLGTGMRASVMVFLPALTMTGRIEALTQSALKLGLTIRGKHGEGSKADGYLYQISNEISLGQSEQQILQNVKSITTKICQMEEEFMKEMLAQKQDELIDLTSRALAILKNAHLLSLKEAIIFLSQVKLGINLGLIDFQNPKIIDKLMIECQPAHLSSQSLTELKKQDRDKFRAKFVKEKLLQAQ